MSQLRLSSETLLHSNNPAPEMLDYLEFDFKGVTFRCFGILHGITGGLNHDYREFVKETIRSTDGTKLAEKGMKQLYRDCGIDAELEDWLVLRTIDCIVMGFQLIADPRCLWMITIDALREQFSKNDPFIVNGRKYISDLGESRYFHYLDEIERRKTAGFLPSQQALNNDLKSMSRWFSSILPIKRNQQIINNKWKRLLLLERVMHIPCRSIHMIHYAHSYAKQNNKTLINLFVGETHNTDMKYLSQHSNQLIKILHPRQKKIITKIIKRASITGNHTQRYTKTRLFIYKLKYLIALLLGALIPVILYLWVFIYLKN